MPWHNDQMQPEFPRIHNADGTPPIDPTAPAVPIEVEPFDILASYGTNAVSRIITLRTWSPFGPPRLRLPPSHVSIITTNPFNRLPVVVESTTLCNHPCLFRRDYVSGAQAHHPADRICDYAFAGGRVDVYRMARPVRFARDDEALSATLIDGFVRPGRCYDYSGAILSGTVHRYFRHIAALCSPTHLETLFCSEMIAFALMTTGAMNWQNPARFSPGRLLRHLVKLGIYEFSHTYRAAA